MVGGTIGGYWEIGRVKRHTPPATTMTMGRTHAKVGWSQNTRDRLTVSPDTAAPTSRSPVLCPQQERRHVHRPGLDLDPRPHPLQTVHDHPVARLQDLDLPDHRLAISAGLGQLAKAQD